jgi:hypothetical protein
MADNAESSEKQNFVGEKKKSHGATRHCSYAKDTFHVFISEYLQYVAKIIAICKKIPI